MAGTGMHRYGTYGFRFTEKEHIPLYGLFALGYDRVDNDYEWDGLKRIDGPLYLFQYTVSGRGRLEKGDRIYEIGPGDAFMVDIPSPHRYYLPAGSGSWEFYFMLFRKRQLEPLWAAITDRLGNVARFENDSPAIRVLQAAYSDAAGGRITDAFFASSLVYRFVMELARFDSRPSPGQRPAQIRRAEAYMAEMFAQPISVDDIAGAAGLSKFHFTRLFTRTTGHTPGDYLTRIRIQKAAELLRETDWTIDRVAEQAGFGSGSYFSKVFRRWVGYPPGEYRSGREVLAAHTLVFD